jgi:lipoprotein-anchoring transpeptidase ErfK/SrfK
MSRLSVRPRLALLGAGVLLAVVSACSVSTGSGGSDEATGDGGSTPEASPAPKASAATISSNITRGARNIGLQRRIRLDVASGTFQAVQVTGPRGAIVRGALSDDKTHWVSAAQLQQASRYRVVGSAVDAEGLRAGYESVFSTRKLGLDEQTFASFVPLQGQTVGVGMPVIIRFDVPVTDRASIEKHLAVVSRPAQPGAFHWISSQEVHWRPQTFWRPGTDVSVEADIGGVSAGNGIYGQKSRATSFHVGRSMVSKVDMNSDQMRVFENGRLIRTIPITTGQQPKFTTRSGTKVIVEKYRHKRMNSETIGIDPDSADGYDIDDVEYAMRVTYSGEFVHAAPWSVGSQGHANVSHGCTGMSTADAAWLYSRSMVGDVVQYTGTSKPTDLTNGFGDWNLPFRAYRTGSALS